MSNRVMSWESLCFPATSLHTRNASGPSLLSVLSFTGVVIFLCTVSKTEMQFDASELYKKGKR